MLDFSQFKDALAQFHEEFATELMDLEWVAVELHAGLDAASPEIIVKLSGSVDSTPGSMRAGSTFEYDGRSFAVRVMANRKIVAQIEAGTAARPEGAPYYGTYGGPIMLNGVLVAISNWHVFCRSGNSSSIGDRIQIDGKTTASLYDFEPVNEFGNNEYDIAFAEFDDPEGIEAQFRECSGGTRLRFPRRLAWSVEFGKAHYTVGARSPACGHGKLLGVASIRVNYGNGRLIPFSNQLMFSKMSNRGDSGSLVVDEERHEAVGLIFAGDDDSSYANFLPGYSNFLTRGSIDLRQSESLMSFAYQPTMRKEEVSFGGRKSLSMDMDFEKDGVAPSVDEAPFPRDLIDPTKRVRFFDIHQHHQIRIADVQGSWVKAQVFAQRDHTPGHGIQYYLAATGFFNVNAPSRLYYLG
ncbi:hypothetical protein [uncultured Shimia sp.]|uniref:hypothetical protein n=1 Tax=uncultured Shimia sp. TaxID=573152 RepID=UPI0025E0A040|nr:hypothetical protein [uncultured Shimia sp.]